MPDPATLRNIQQMTDALTKCGVVTLEDLRMCIGKEVHAGINWTALNTGASFSLLTALLIAEVREDAEPNGKRKLLPYWRELKTLPSVLMLSAAEIQELWLDKGVRGLWQGRMAAWAVIRQSAVRPKRLFYNWRRHWLDVLALIILPLFIIGLAVRANQINDKKIERVAVKQTAGLPAFHKIKEEVEMKSAPGAQGAFTYTSQVRDLYTLVPIPAGAIVQRDQLLSAELSEKMKGRKILSVPLKTGTYSSTLSPPSTAIMVLSANRPEFKSSEPIALDIILLKMVKEGDAGSAIVALTEDNFKIAAPLLASHDVFLSQTVP